MRASPPRRRSRLKQAALARALTGEIVRGALRPGELLPGRVELAEHFGVSTKTLQGAIDRLLGHGVLRATSGTGTWVAEHPPHLCQYGLALTLDASKALRSPYLSSLLAASSQTAHLAPRRIKAYFGDSPHTESRILADIDEHLLAGLISPSASNVVLHLCAQRPNNPPVVCSVNSEVPNLLGIHLDALAFVGRALDAAIAQGRRRPAMILPYGFCGQMNQFLRTAIQRGLEMTDTAIQFVLWRAGEEKSAPTHQLVGLLMDRPPAVRPDCLIIGEDVILPDVVAKLRTLGMAIPEDVAVISHCNYPDVVAVDCEVTFLGYDAREFIEIAITLIDQAREGIMPARSTPLPIRSVQEVAQIEARRASGPPAIGHSDASRPLAL